MFIVQTSVVLYIIYDALTHLRIRILDAEHEPTPPKKVPQIIDD